VVLCDEEPDQAVRHVLYTHDASSKVVYLRGSPFQARVSLMQDVLSFCYKVFAYNYQGVLPRMRDVLVVECALGYINLVALQGLQRCHTAHSVHIRYLCARHFFPSCRDKVECRPG
jgi:hypothetical protein